MKEKKTIAISPKKFSKKKFKLIPMPEGKFKDLIGALSITGSWMIYGGSGEGKTTFALMLLKFLCDFKKCAYIPLEEGLSPSFQYSFNEANLLSSSANLRLWKEHTVDDIDEELSKSRAPEVIFIDSLQYLRKSKSSVNQITKFEYIEMLRRHPTTLFIFISHAKNGEPKNAIGEDVYYGSHICMLVKNYMIQPIKNRFRGKIPFDLND